MAFQYDMKDLPSETAIQFWTLQVLLQIAMQNTLMLKLQTGELTEVQAAVASAIPHHNLAKLQAQMHTHAVLQGFAMPTFEEPTPKENHDG